MESLEQLREKMVYLEQQLALFRQERFLNQLLVDGLDFVLAGDHRPQILERLVQLLVHGFTPCEGALFAIHEQKMCLCYPTAYTTGESYPLLPQERVLNVFNVSLLPGWHTHFAPQWPTWRSALLMPLSTQNHTYLVLLGREEIGAFEKKQTALLQTFCAVVATVRAHISAALLQASHQQQQRTPTNEFSQLAAVLLQDLRGTINDLNA